MERAEPGRRTYCAMGALPRLGPLGADIDMGANEAPRWSQLILGEGDGDGANLRWPLWEAAVQTRLLLAKPTAEPRPTTPGTRGSSQASTRVCPVLRVRHVLHRDQGVSARKELRDASMHVDLDRGQSMPPA